jgi:hypothetical protein
VVGYCEQGTEPSASVKRGKNLDQLRHYKLLSNLFHGVSFIKIGEYLFCVTVTPVVMWAPVPTCMRWLRENSHHCLYRELNPCRPARSIFTIIN